MTVTASLPDLDRMEAQHGAVLEEAAMRAEFEMRAYVPLREGLLRASGQLVSRFGAGLLIWATPYAAAQYYVPMAHDNPKAPLATDHWDEAWRRDRWDDFCEYERRIYTDGVR